MFIQDPLQKFKQRRVEATPTESINSKQNPILSDSLLKKVTLSYVVAVCVATLLLV